MEAGLQWIGGRAILNSANLEDGEAPGHRASTVSSRSPRVRRGRHLPAIDEEGQARDVEWKMRVAHRITTSPSTATASNQRPHLRRAHVPAVDRRRRPRRDAMATMEAIRRIKAEIPGRTPSLGLSNVSFGLKPGGAPRPQLGLPPRVPSRQGSTRPSSTRARSCRCNRSPTSSARSAWTSIYDRARDAGGDGLRPAAEAARAVRRREGADASKEDRTGWSVDKRLSQRIIDGDRDGLEADLDEALGPGSRRSAIINDTCSPA